MEAMDYWRLCDELNVVQAVLLVLEIDPSDGNEACVINRSSEERPKGFDAIFSALTNVISSRTLPAKLIYSGDYIEYRTDDSHQSDLTRNEIPDWRLTTVKVTDLREWLFQRGIKTGFFFPHGADAVSYLNSNHPCYAPKLAAAVKAWEVVSSDKNRLRGKTPKQALEKWLREHASEFELTDEDGNPYNAAIEQISKVANWNLTGGAAKTPTSPPVVSDSSPPKKDIKNQNNDWRTKYEIPF